jgi:hypothetical protein
MSAALPVAIRRARADDAARLALVGQATFVETFAGVLDGGDIVAHCAREHSLEHYERCLADGAMQLWLAEVPPGQAPIGYLVSSACSLPVADIGDEDVEVKRIYVLHRFIGAGVGARLSFARVRSRTRPNARVSDAATAVLPLDECC